MGDEVKIAKEGQVLGPGEPLNARLVFGFGTME